MAFHRVLACWQVGNVVFAGFFDRRLGAEVDLARLDPALQFLIEGLFALGGEGLDFVVVVCQKLLVVLQVEAGFLDLYRVVAIGKVPPDLLQFFGTDFVEAHLIEETQQPGFAGLKQVSGAVRFHICRVRPTN